MDISPKGLLEILSHEGCCLDPYLDSVGVWTIGVGITKYDGKDPRDFGTITLEQAIDMFRDRIRAYVTPVQKLNLPLFQHQFDALVSFCFNVGPGNLAKLAKGRSVDQIGDALMLYTKPVEITERRRKEQNLFKYGKYTNTGKVLVFPVSANHHPVYSQGRLVDATKLNLAPKPSGVPQRPVQPISDAAPIVLAPAAAIAAHASGAPLWAILAIVGAVVLGFVIWKMRR
jgi:lysozyme